MSQKGGSQQLFYENMVVNFITTNTKERIFNEEEQETNGANAHYNNPNPNVDGDIDIIQER